MTSEGFVPVGFEPPSSLVTDRFHLEPLGPQHNEADHAAWMSSIEHIRSTPGFADGEQGLADWVRRLHQTPGTDDLVAMDSQGRRFEGQLAEYLRLRDRRCRNPWCNAPIRHLDHAKDVAKGGRTSASNGQGLCEACNHAKQADGWAVRPVDGPVHTIEIVNPTGHRYLSTVPTTGPPIWMELYPQAKRVA
jgi:hypothetical protein